MELFPGEEVNPWPYLSRTMKRNILISFAVFLTLFIALCSIPFILGPDYLIAEESMPSEKADAIIVLSGSADRLEQAAELYGEGYADKVILTNSTEESTTPARAMSFGVPEEAIISEPKADSTYENATKSKKIMKEKDFESAIVVTSEFHSRRTKYTFDRIYDHDTEMFYSFSSSYFNPSDGLSEQESMTTFSEYVKLLGYSIRLFFS